MSRIHYKNLCAFPGRTGEPFLTEFTVEDGIFIADDSPAPDGTEIVTIDMRGAFVMPAFIDAHAHPDGLAMTMGGGRLYAADRSFDTGTPECSAQNGCEASGGMDRRLGV